MAELRKFSKRKTSTQDVLVKVEERNQYLAFTLGGESYAMDIRSVKEVIQFTGLTEVPMMPSFIRGVLNLRGAVVPVIDISVRFSQPPTEVSRRTCVVILEVVHQEGSAVLGVMVDNVSEVLELGAGDIEPAPSFGGNARSEFITGIGKVGTKFIILLNVHRILSTSEMAALTAEGATD